LKQNLLILFLLGFFILPWNGQAETTWQESFNDQVKKWTIELAEHDKRFTALVNTPFSQQGLGPHSKQWLVIFKCTEGNCGYFVVGHSEDNSFMLLEYGLGEYSLFDESIVQPFKTSEENLKPHYRGLESVWTSADSIYDAKSGEKYPAAISIEASPMLSNIHQGISLQRAMQQEHQMGDEAFEEVWLQPGPQVTQQSHLMKALHSEHQVALIGKLFQGKVTAPFPVVGYHLWDQEELFVELDDYGSRYIPFGHAIKMGSFTY
jgi:hypothetical protein